VIALGLEAAGVFTTDDSLCAELVSAGERTEERLWRLPLWDEYKENIRSDWADVKNTGGRWGGASNGAMFLKEFVPEGTAWAHLDIAGTAWKSGVAKGATGRPVPLLTHFVLSRVR
jgi:leucyl aminopeptidase